MKVVLVLFLFIAATSAAALNEKILVRDHLDDLITKALEYFRTILKVIAVPSALPQLVNQPLVDTDVDLIFSIKDQYIIDSSLFDVDSVHVDPKTLKSTFHLTSAVNQIEGSYKISGTVKGKEAEGESTFSMNVTDLVVAGEVDFDLVDHHLIIKDITWDSSIGDLKADMEDLNIEEMDKKEINELISKQFLNFANAKRFVIEAMLSIFAKNFFNRVLQEYTVQQILDWLEQIVASTPYDVAATLAPKL